MIEYVSSGDLLKADVNALVNTVNTKGSMGGGIARQFREAFPAVYDEYREACEYGDVRVGRMYVALTGVDRPKYIIHFPTKDHYRDPSLLEYIELGLEDLQLVQSP